MVDSPWKKWYNKNKSRFLELVNKHKKNRRRDFQKIIDSRKDVPCIVCDEKYAPEAMDFYHRDKDQKFFRISDATRLIYSIEKLINELDKCDVYCANCRRIVDMEELLKGRKGKGLKGSKLRRKILRELINEMKSVPCDDCKKVYPPYCMEFDHLGEVPKEGTIARMVSEGKPIDVIKVEIEKTIPVCVNCHRVRTRSRK